MYLSRNKKYEKPKEGMGGQFHFSHHEFNKEMEKIQKDQERQESLPEPKDMLIEEHSKDVILHWRAPEFETFERDRKWYIVISAILLAIVAYAVYTNALIMAITFILIGVVGYMYINKEARVLDFMITRDGIIAGKEIYEFHSLKSFWIFYEPHGVEVISLHTGSYLVPHVHIPLGDENPAKIREILLVYIPEEKHEPGPADTLDRLIHL